MGLKIDKVGQGTANQNSWLHHFHTSTIALDCELLH